MASTNFINECKNRANANRLGKIIIDGITSPITNSDNLQSFEIDSGCYTDGNIIGSVYAKYLKANFIAEQNNLTDKHIQAQIGVKYTDLSNEYINMGKYKVERPNNEITANMSQITAYSDLYTNLDSKYICNIDYSTGDKTLSDLYVDVCNQLGLTPVTTTFINSTIPITANPFTNGEKNRTLLQTIAKISCSFIDIDNDTNKIDLCWLSSSKTPDYTFYKNDYSSVEGGQVVCGPINCLIIKNSQVDDENVTIKDDESIKKNGENSIIISEDYILYNSDLRQQAITDIWNRVKGMKYVDCKLTTYYGKPFLKLGDYIRIYTSETKYFDTYVLKHNFTYDGSFTSIIESPVLTEQEIKTKQNISLGEALRNTQIIVDKQLGKITSTVDEMNTKVEDITTTTQTSTGGNSLYLKEALESNALEYSIDGKCEQSTSTQGKNYYTGNKLTNGTNHGITYTFDNSILKLNGTSSDSGSIVADGNTKINIPAGTYAYSMRKKSGSFTQNNKDLAIYLRSATGFITGDGTSSGLTLNSISSSGSVKKIITVSKDTELYIRIFVNGSGLVCNNLELEIQIEPGSSMTDFEQFVPNSPSPDYPSEIKTIKGIRNLLNSKVASQIIEGITFTPNDDGTVRASGTTGSNPANYNLYNNNFDLKSGTYTLSGCPNGGSSSKYYIGQNIAPAYGNEFGNGLTFTINSDISDKSIWLSIRPNQTVDVLFKPMLEQGSVAHSYVPYGTYEKIKVTGKNWFDKDNTYTAIGEVSGYVSSDYIPVKKGDTINKTNSVMFWFYDKSKNQIGFASGSTTTIVSLDNIAYVRCNVLKTDLDTFMLTINQELTDYEPYKEKEVLIDLAKENLCNISKWQPYQYSNSLPVSISSNITINSSNNNNINFTINNNLYLYVLSNVFELEPNTTYTISYNRTNSQNITSRYYIYAYENDTYSHITNGTDDNVGKTIIFTTSASGKIAIAFGADNKANNTTCDISNIKIYKGTNADDSYELNSIGDIKDKLEIINGVAVIQKKIGKVVLDGTETGWGKSGATGNISYYYSAVYGTSGYKFNDIDLTNVGTTSSTTPVLAYCDYFQSIAGNKIFTDIKGLIFDYISNTKTIELRLGFGLDTTITTVDLLKAWLKVNPVTVYYILNEPETIALPNTNISLYENVNHVTLVEDLETTTSIKYLRKTPISGEYALNQDLNKTNSNLADTNNQLSQTQSDIDNTKTNLNNNYYNKEQVDSINSTTTQNITQIRNTMEENITSTNASISKIQEEITNGVSKVTTTTGTFDENGLNISKSGQQMSSTLDWDGLEVVRDKGKATETEVLTVRSAGVEAENMTVRNFFIKKPIRIEKCKSITDSTKVGLGFFWIGE